MKAAASEEVCVAALDFGIQSCTAVQTVGAAAQHQQQQGAAVPKGGGPTQSREWKLSKLAFLSKGCPGTMILDSGTESTVTTTAFVRRAALEMRPFPAGMVRTVRTANGGAIKPAGLVDLPVFVSLQMETEDGQFVQWDRSFTLRDVWVLDLGLESPRDLYVSWADYQYNAQGSEPDSPLGSLAYLVTNGARLLDSPRPPAPGAAAPQHIVLQRHLQVPLAAMVQQDEEEAFRAAVLERIPPQRHDSLLAKRLVDELWQRRKVFGPLDPAETTEVVEFQLIGEDPTPVSFRVPITKHMQLAAAKEGLQDWITKRVCSVVPWTEKAYGFVIVVPKANGKWRVTVNPSAVNAATKRIDPEGGYMPANILSEAQKVRGQKLAILFDLAEAFLSIKLGPEAQRLSTFTTVLGKVRWHQGYFGWHSFPSAFQRIIMERVVLPTMDQFKLATLLAWIDDLVVAAGDDYTLLAASMAVVDRILEFGGRLSLSKCFFLVERFDWCGVEVNLATQEWRIAPERVESLRAIPIPRDREALSHLLGVLRHYYWGVHDHPAQRVRMAALSELDVPGTRVAAAWQERHTVAMKEAIEAIVKGDWALIFDPTQPVWVNTDASGDHGFAVVATQYDQLTGKMRPIAFQSYGWISTQLKWTPQVKEAYAAQYAVTKTMPRCFPFADVILLVDNKNIVANGESEDARVTRWKQNIRDTGCVEKRWIPGNWNSIADYGSRCVQAQPEAALTAEQQFECNFFALLQEGRGGGAGEALPATTAGILAQPTVVPGHLPMASVTAKIVAAQAEASPEERATWQTKHHRTETLAGQQLVLFKNRLLVPMNAAAIKSVLMRMCHDECFHYPGGERTLSNLHTQAKVTWVGIDRDVQEYVKTCYRCEWTKSTTEDMARRGQLNPTLAPSVDHTWYMDFKGPMPHGSGYILAVVDAISRYTKLRYCPAATGKELCEEIEEVINDMGTSPVVIRSDGGQPFDSEEYRDFCTHWNIRPVVGIPHHSQGQGLVETRFRGIAAAIIATMGARAPRLWYKGPLLGRLERIINSTKVEPLGGSPYWARFGKEPRTPLTSVDWTAQSFSEELFGVKGFSHEDYNNIIAEHHSQMDRVHGRALLATSLAQAVTKGRYDSKRQAGDFKAGDWFLVHSIGANKMSTDFTGPYEVLSVSADNNFITGRHFASKAVAGPFHVSRALHFDISRASKDELADFQLEAGSGTVHTVLDHRALADGSQEFLIKWLGDYPSSWLAGREAKHIAKVKDYCREKQLPLPGEGVRAVAAAAAQGPQAARRGSDRRRTGGPH